MKDEITEMGARLAFVGHGGVEYARSFHDHYVPDCTVVTDPSAYTYRALGASESAIGTIAGFGIHGVRAMAKGHVQTRILGRSFQNGGVLIAAPGDVARYVYISRLAGDHPRNAVILDAIRRATVEGADTPPVYAALDSRLVAASRPWTGLEERGGLQPHADVAAPRPAFPWTPPPPLKAPSELSWRRHSSDTGAA